LWLWRRRRSAAADRASRPHKDSNVGGPRQLRGVRANLPAGGSAPQADPAWRGFALCRPRRGGSRFSAAPGPADTVRRPLVRWRRLASLRAAPSGKITRSLRRGAGGLAGRRRAGPERREPRLLQVDLARKAEGRRSPGRPADDVDWRPRTDRDNDSSGAAEIGASDMRIWCLRAPTITKQSTKPIAPVRLRAHDSRHGP